VCILNIFLFELRAQRKSFFVWTASLLAVFAFFMGIFYGPFMNSKAAVQDALSSLPPAFAAIFGVEMDIFFSYGGFFQFLYTYLSLIGAIMAAIIAVSVFSREKRSKCVDFLFTRPVDRRRVFLIKLLSCLTLIIAANILFLAVSAVFYLGKGEDTSGLGRVLLASLALFFTQLVFLSLGILLAVFAKKIRSVSGSATVLGLAGFVLMGLYALTEEDALRFLSPLSYFRPQSVFATGGFEGEYAAAAAAVILACIALSYFRYCRSDTRAI